MEEAESIKTSAAIIMAARLLETGDGEEAGVRSTNNDKSLGAVRDDTEGREVDRVQENINKIIKVDSNLKSEEESRYKKIWKLFKEVVFPGPEAERLQSKKIEKKTPVKGVVKEVSKEEKEKGKGIFGTILGVLGTLGSTLLGALGSIPGLIMSALGLLPGLVTGLLSGLLSGLGSVGKVLGTLGRLTLSFGSVIARAVMSIGRAAASAGRAIGRAAASVGRAIGRAAASAGRAIASAGRAIGRAAASAGRAIGRAAGAAGRGLATAARAAAPALGVAGAVVGAAAIGAAVGTVLENSDMNPIRWLAGMEQKSEEEAADRERMAQHNRKESFEATKLHQDRLENIIKLYGAENVKVVEGAIKVVGKSSTDEVRKKATKFNVSEDSQVVAAENALRAYKEESKRLAALELKKRDQGWYDYYTAAEKGEWEKIKAQQLSHMRKSDMFRKNLDDATNAAIKRRQDTNKILPKPVIPLKVNQALPNSPKPSILPKEAPKVTIPLEDINPTVVDPFLASKQQADSTQFSNLQKSQEDTVNRMVDVNSKSHKLTDKYIKDNTSINERIASLAEEQTQLLQLVVANISKVGGGTTVVNTGNKQNKPPGTFNMRTEFGKSTV